MYLMLSLQNLWVLYDPVSRMRLLALCRGEGTVNCDLKLESMRGCLEKARVAESIIAVSSVGLWGECWGSDRNYL